MERSCKLLRGDLLVELIDAHVLRAIDIARHTGEKPSDPSAASAAQPEAEQLQALLGRKTKDLSTYLKYSLIGISATPHGRHAINYPA